MLTRRAVQPREKVYTLAVKSKHYAPITPSLDLELDWPTQWLIIASQDKNDVAPPHEFVRNESGWIDKQEKMWIPVYYDKMKLRIPIAAFTGYDVHRGVLVI